MDDKDVRGEKYVKPQRESHQLKPPEQPIRMKPSRTKLERFQSCEAAFIHLLLGWQKVSKPWWNQKITEVLLIKQCIHSQKSLSSTMTWSSHLAAESQSQREKIDFSSQSHSQSWHRFYPKLSERAEICRCKKNFCQKWSADTEEALKNATGQL